MRVEAEGGLEINRSGTEEARRERVKNACVLAAPTGCASFQLKYGASTLHRAFGIPVQYCGRVPDGARTRPRFQNMRTRMRQAQLFVIDELSMVGRGMLGKIEFKVRDVLTRSMPGAPESEEGPVYLAGKDAVLSGDLKQATPIGDDPVFRQGVYAGKGKNKPRNAAEHQTRDWDTRTLHAVGGHVRDSFEDVVMLRRVHRYAEQMEGATAAVQAEYKRDAARFLDVTRGMAECTWTKADHAWLERRNRSALQQTPEGRAALREFEDAPLLMDGREDRVTGEVGAKTVNRMRLERLSAETQKPIAVLEAFYSKPQEEQPGGRARGKRAPRADARPELLDAEDFKGIENEVLLCEGARVLLTQNLWVEAGLMNGALGKVVGYMWPEGADPHSDRKELWSPSCVFV